MLLKIAAAAAAAPVVSPVSPVSPVGPEYAVMAGDTLSAIAKRNNTTWQELARLNGLSDPNRLSVGQRLRLPRPPAPSSTPLSRLNQVAARLHMRLNNPALEAAILANFNRETGGKFDYATQQIGGGGGYGLPQYTGTSLAAYKAWLEANKRQDSANSQIDYFTGYYMPSRPEYKTYMAPGAKFTKEQYADWLHRRVFTPAYTIRGNKAYSTAAILRQTQAHGDFMRNGLRAVNGVWQGVL